MVARGDAAFRRQALDARGHPEPGVGPARRVERALKGHGEITLARGRGGGERYPGGDVRLVQGLADDKLWKQTGLTTCCRLALQLPPTP